MVSPIGTKASEEQCYMGTYHSTRGRTLSCSSKVAIRTGIAPDGGLFVSDELGTQQVDISSLADKSYFEIAQDVLGMSPNDYTAEEISACVDEAYRGTFASEEVTPLVKLDAAPGVDAPQTYVMELFGGPTSAFKDVALQMLPRLMARTSAKDGGAERIMIVTATSGDTGKAALAGFADAPGTGITVFYPEGKVSRVQNLQMSTQEGDNVAVCGIRGNFDDAQSAVKHIFADKELAERLEAAGTVLSSANSINVGRLVPQVVYYFAAYAQLLRAGAIEAGDAVEFCVPTGNFGDILAGYYAKRMGLPVAKLIVASDKNNVLADFLTTRRLRPQPSVLHDHLAVDGHPHQLQPGTHALLPVRWRLRARCRPYGAAGTDWSLRGSHRPAGKVPIMSPPPSWAAPSAPLRRPIRSPGACATR